MAEELIRCECSQDNNDVVHLSRYALKDNGRLDFETIMFKIVCRKCLKCTGGHTEQAVIAERWTKMAGI